jgi:hypothetical protein
VPDLIRNAITGRGERQVWQRLKEQHPEVEELVDGVRFCDANGRLHKDPTPVVDLEGWLQILALLPGAAGKKKVADRVPAQDWGLIDPGEPNLFPQKSPEINEETRGCKKQQVAISANGMKHLLAHVPNQELANAWNNTPIQRRVSDDYVNATAMCKANGKRWSKGSLPDGDYLLVLEDGRVFHSLRQVAEVAPGLGFDVLLTASGFDHALLGAPGEHGPLGRPAGPRPKGWSSSLHPWRAPVPDRVLTVGLLVWPPLHPPGP